MSILVLVADAGRARIFSASQKKEKYLEEGDLIHSRSRLKGTQVQSDGPGTVYDSSGKGRHVVGNVKGIHKQESEVFAREVCVNIKQRYISNKFTQLYLIAPPEFLGFLRIHLDGELKKLIGGEIDKDIVQLKTDEIRSHLLDIT